MNKSFAKATTTTDETKKLFAFDFSLDIGEDTKDNSKNRPKKKKKKPSVICGSKAELDSDSTGGDNLSLNVNVSPIKEDQKGDLVNVNQNKEKTVEKMGNLLKINDLIMKVDQTNGKVEEVTEKKGNALEIDDLIAGISENINVDKRKKKKKKKSGGKTLISENEKDEDIVFLVNEINDLAIANTSLINTIPTASIKKSSSAVTTTPKSKNQQKPLKSNLKASVSNSSKNSSNAASFSFKSHKDPELSLEQK
jgi:hypothetical protein